MPSKNTVTLQVKNRRYNLYLLIKRRRYLERKFPSLKPLKIQTQLIPFRLLCSTCSTWCHEVLCRSLEPRGPSCPRLHVLNPGHKCSHTLCHGDKTKVSLSLSLEWEFLFLPFLLVFENWREICQDRCSEASRNRSETKVRLCFPFIFLSSFFAWCQTPFRNFTKISSF